MYSKSIQDEWISFVQQGLPFFRLFALILIFYTPSPFWIILLHSNLPLKFIHNFAKSNVINILLDLIQTSFITKWPRSSVASLYFNACASCLLRGMSTVNSLSSGCTKLWYMQSGPQYSSLCLLISLCADRHCTLSMSSQQNVFGMLSSQSSLSQGLILRSSSEMLAL